MSKEVYVSFETAQLLKKKGFDWEVNGYFCSDVDNPSRIEWSTKDYNSHKFHVSAPTQQMAMRWLREEKGIHIYTVPELSSDKFYVSIAVNVNSKWRLHANFPAPLLDEKYIKCEDAIEAALQYVLKNLI